MEPGHQVLRHSVCVKTSRILWTAPYFPRYTARRGFAQTPNRRNGTIKYFIPTNGNRTHNCATTASKYTIYIHNTKLILKPHITEIRKVDRWKGYAYLIYPQKVTCIGYVYRNIIEDIILCTDLSYISDQTPKGQWGLFSMLWVHSPIRGF